MKDVIGVVHGRFQLLHNDHVKYILTGMEKCEHMIIGICNPDVAKTEFSETNPHRSQKESNPFSYYERYQMIKGTLLDMNIGLDKFDIVPFPINFPALIFNYAPQNAKYYMSIYDEWGIKKKEVLENLGCNIEILWHVSLEEKGISGTDVRKRILLNKEWKHLVPHFVYEYVTSNYLDERIRNQKII